MTPIVRIKRTHPAAVMPRYMSELAAGLDLVAAIDAPTWLWVGARMTIDTGIAIELPPGYVGLVCPRSGIAAKHGITLLNSPGVIDADYRGPIGALLINHGSQAFWIEPGNRIAQLVVMPVARAELVEVDELSPTERGAGGWGSTGQGGGR